MEIGIKLKELRLKNQLTQEELADRSELTKGYISQLENDLTSPSIATLKDILQALGSSLSAFFSEDEEEPLVFTKEDYFLKEGENSSVTWLVPTAQKNAMEPIMLRLKGGAATEKDLPHDGEEFGYVLKGTIKVCVGKRDCEAKEGESFYFRSNKTHYLVNLTDEEAVVLWLSCPPNF
ncbi:MAG TPA: XRE family transcriptional regulator [Firmicutes bacterium]|nr:XRE family transcriptional regulator [Bacillota bacterium]